MQYPFFFTKMMLSVFLLLGACSDKEKVASTSVSTIKTTGSFETSISLSQNRTTTVNYVINWSSSNGSVTGVYRDSYFTLADQSLTGSLTNQSFVFQVDLPEAVGNVKTLVLSQSSESLFTASQASLELSDESGSGLETLSATLSTTVEPTVEKTLAPYLLGQFVGQLSETSGVSPCPPDDEREYTVTFVHNVNTGVVTLSTQKGSSNLSLGVTYAINMGGFVQVIATDSSHKMVARVSQSYVENAPVIEAEFNDEDNLCTWSMTGVWGES